MLSDRVVLMKGCGHCINLMLFLYVYGECKEGVIEPPVRISGSPIRLIQSVQTGDNGAGGRFYPQEFIGRITVTWG